MTALTDNFRLQPGPRFLNGHPDQRVHGFHIDRSGSLLILTKPRYLHGRPNLDGSVYGGTVRRDGRNWTHDLSTSTYPTQDMAGCALYALLTSVVR